jgi:hypothetical protein
VGLPVKTRSDQKLDRNITTVYMMISLALILEESFRNLDDLRPSLAQWCQSEAHREEMAHDESEMRDTAQGM